MLKFRKTELYSGKKIEIFDMENNILNIYIEYYDKSNIQLVKNLEILNINNELLPIHYTFEMRKNRYFKKIMMFSQPKKLDIHLKSLSITSNNLNKIYKKIIKLVGKNKQIVEATLLINTNNNQVLYTFDKVYKKEFKWFNKANYKEDLILVNPKITSSLFFPYPVI